jgi:hypothetical protein
MSTKRVCIYPNPAKDGNFTLDGIESIKQIEMLDLNGRKIAEFRNSDRPLVKIQMNVSCGVYVLNLFDGEQYFRKKIVIN